MGTGGVFVELVVGSTTAHFSLGNGVWPCHVQKRAVQGKVSAELSLLGGLTTRLWYQKRLFHMLCDASEEVRNGAVGGMAACCSSQRRNREAWRTATGE